MSDTLCNTYTANSQVNPSITMDADGDFLITWNSYTQDGDYYGVYTQRYDSAGITK